MNTQRQVIYAQRRRVLEGQDLSEEVQAWIDEVIERIVSVYTESEFTEEWDLAQLVQAVVDLYGTDITVEELRAEVELSREAITEEFQNDARDVYAEKEQELGAELMRELERFVILQVVDTRWREHLENMDYLREGVHLRAFAQKDPLVEYRGEGHVMFEEMSYGIREEVLLHLFHAQLAPEEAEALQAEQAAAVDGDFSYEHELLAGAEAIAAAGAGAGVGVATAGAVAAPATTVSTNPQQRVAGPHEKLGRNDPCWCGSGKKYKKCHGA
jgi:preprotein translocase subunit SecA